MSINLRKGQSTAVGQGINNVTAEMSWNKSTNGGPKLDLDVSVFLLDDSKNINTEGNFVFYGNLRSPDNAVEHSQDERDGGIETVKIDFTKLDSRIKELLFVVTIDGAPENGLTLGSMRNSKIRLINNTNNVEICKYVLDEEFSVETAVEVCKFVNINGAWQFEAIGTAYTQDLAYFLGKHFSGEIIK